MDNVQIKRALISVTDKTNLEDLAKVLVDHGIEIVSSGGTAAHLSKFDIPFTEVSDYTQSPEMLDGRLKTLHPKIHGGILAIRSSDRHQKEMREQNFDFIDLVIVNLYAFEAAAANPALSFLDTIEQVDIGGPTLLRAAAKNYPFVTVLTDPAQYEAFQAELETHQGKTTLAYRKKMAEHVFTRTSAYDAAIVDYFHRGQPELPQELRLSLTQKAGLRYGENPHQPANFYQQTGTKASIIDNIIQGKALSYNNLSDSDAALDLISDFGTDNGYVVAIFKHANPCGVGISNQSLLQAYQHALAGDPVSAFGGIVVFSHTLDETTAITCLETFTEVVLAPEVTPEAIACFKKKKNLRLLTYDLDELRARQKPYLIKPVLDGYLVQSRDTSTESVKDAKIVTQRPPTDEEQKALELAWKVVKHVKSNAIVLANHDRILGTGAGQMSRVDSTWIAKDKMRDPSPPIVLASDAFFPFSDSIDHAAKAGVTAIIQPGGSMRDKEVIEAADKANMAMLLTGTRHFRH